MCVCSVTWHRWVDRQMRGYFFSQTRCISQTDKFPNSVQLQTFFAQKAPKFKGSLCLRFADTTNRKRTWPIVYMHEWSGVHLTMDWLRRNKLTMYVTLCMCCVCVKRLERLSVYILQLSRIPVRAMTKPSRHTFYALFNFKRTFCVKICYLLIYVENLSGFWCLNYCAKDMSMK